MCLKKRCLLTCGLSTTRLGVGGRSEELTIINIETHIGIGTNLNIDVARYKTLDTSRRSISGEANMNRNIGINVCISIVMIQVYV